MAWINVNKQLPDPNGGIDYLVCDFNNCCAVAFFNKNGKWETFTTGWHRNDITHWMPLPKRPNQYNKKDAK